MGFRDAFEIKYRIDGVLYVFNYSYNGQNPVGKERNPGKEKYKPFNNTISGDPDCFYGEATKGKTAIRIWIYPNDSKVLWPKYFCLEQFHLKKLSNR